MKISKMIALAMMLAAGNIVTNAQTIQGADPTNGSNTLNVNSTCLTTSTLTCLNIDMVDIASDVSNPTPSCIWGTGANNYIWAAGIAGATCGGNNYSGITIWDPLTFSQQSLPLPFYGSPMAGQQVDYVDVAVGVCTNHPWKFGPRYFVLAVYESMGNIYLEHYNIDMDYTGGTTICDVDAISFPPYFSYITNNPVQLNTVDGTARYPHIDLIYDEVRPAAGVAHEAIGYVVTWEEGAPGSEEIWGIDGPISVSGSNNPPPPHTLPFYIDDGKFPDVAGVTAALTVAASPPAGPSKAYTAYLNRNGDEVHLSEWEYNSGPMYVINNLGAISATVGADEFQYPRISAPQYFDFNVTPVDEPVCVVAVSENDASSNYKINTYAYHDPMGTPYVIDFVDASDYMFNGFNTAGKQAIKPVITGVGNMISSFYPTTGTDDAYSTYPTMFYSDHTHNPLSFPNSGDFYAFGTETGDNINTTATVFPGTSYYEANDGTVDLPVISPFSYSGTQPVSAIATCNNSGYDLMVAYWDGTRIRRRYTTGGSSSMPYAFKPSKTTGIENLNESNIAVYPNPVSTHLNITQADGADYTVTDMAGRAISSGRLSGNKDAINTMPLAAGVYILHLSKEGHTEQVKFTKK